VKFTSFTVRATLEQSRRWKMASDGEGCASVGSWLALAADAHLQHRIRAGRPLPLAWRVGRVPVELKDGSKVTLPGFVSPPFGAFRGSVSGPRPEGCHTYSLVHLSTGRVIATFRTYKQCKALASELAPLLIRDEQASASVVERHVREQA
jgi:hypothetical protein